MPSSVTNYVPKIEALATNVAFTKDTLIVFLADGREISVPLEWSPLLRKATAAQRKKWRLIGGGVGIHWSTVSCLSWKWTLE